MIRTKHGRGNWILGLVLAAGGLVLAGASPARAQAWAPETWGAAAGEPEAWGGAVPVTLLAAAGADARGTAESVLRLGAFSRQPAPIPARRGPLIRRMRPNTVSLGIQGQYGGIRGSSRLADGFDHGPGYAFRFRYMLSPRAALGFSFEHQRFGSVQPPLNVPGDFADSHLVVTTISIEGVFYRHREQMVHPYFVLGAGYASPDIVFAEEVASRVNEGAFLVAGIGFERFIRERFSIDGSIRAHGQIANSEFSSIGQVSLGIHLYPGD
jgi:hypothetical protein